MSQERQGQPAGVLAGHIGWVEATGIILIHTISKVFLIFPSRISMAAQTAAWSVPIFSGILSTAWIWPLVSVLKAHPGKGIVDITRSLLGPYVAFAVGTVFYLFTVATVAASAAEISEALVGVILPLTPERFLMYLGFAVSLYLALKGLEVLGRMCVMGTFLVIGFLLLTSVLSVNQWTTGSVFPLFGPGAARLVKTYAVRQSMYGEVLSLGILFPYLRRPGDAGKVARWSAVVSGAAFSLVILTCEMVFPYPVLNHTIEPLLRVTRLIHLGRFFQRFDAILSPVWLASATLHIATGILVASLALGSICPVKSLGLLEVITAALSLGLAHLVPDMATDIIISFDILRPYSVILLDGWPLALWVASWYRQRMGESQRQ